MRALLTAAALLVAVVADANQVKTRRLLSPLRVVATGDSHTVQYTTALADALETIGPGRYAPKSVAIGGTDAPEYAGWLENPQCACTTDMMADVLALDADVVVFMLGTNDASHPSTGFDSFRALVPGFLETFRSSGATVIVGNPPPVLPLTPYLAGIEERLTRDYEPYLFEMAASMDLPLVDTRSRLTSLPDWQSLYRPGDGVHLSTDGYALMAGWFAEAVDRHAPLFRRRAIKQRPATEDLARLVQPVPQPASLALLALGLSTCCARPRRRRRSA